AAGDEAVAWCRAGKGPFILEMQTYRYRGHSMSDPAKYRTREEVEKIRTDQDPIEQVRNRLLAAKVSEQELKAIDAEVREIVNATMEVEATDEGTLGKILIPEGTADVAVNTPIATILADGESAADLGKVAAPAPQKAVESALPAAAKAEAPQAKAEAPKAVA